MRCGCLREGDFAPWLAFAATVLADVAVQAGELDEAEALIGLLPQEGWPAGVGTVLIPAARGRLRLAHRRPADALADFNTCARIFSSDVWGTEMRDVGYLHAGAGAAQALLLLGERDAARELAQAELADVREFAGPRALGIASRVAELAQGGERAIELLYESVVSLRGSPFTSSTTSQSRRAHSAGRTTVCCAHPAGMSRRPAAQSAWTTSTCCATATVYTSRSAWCSTGC